MRHPAALRKTQASQSFVSIENGNSAYLTMTESIGIRVDHYAFRQVDFAGHLSHFVRLRPLTSKGTLG
ncbi:hypothetical protein [Pollutimonas harenae]|uniref:Uncharacterized protein n=1 Tax=Pollutimonas harenae TaxID=657015 RepID=A0A853GY99_9BURK|nr:hypothetical protein [Pollutimonas harenae]NYT84760.1 hypothetical protein [Pollutimonas harenae]